MSCKFFARGAFALALGVASVAHAASDSDLAEIREQLRQLKASYEARIQALEQRLKEAEASVGAAAPVVIGASAPQGSLPIAAGTSAPQASAPAIPRETPAPPASAQAAAPTDAPARPAASGVAAFNPGISAVLQGAYANLSQDPNRYAIAGFVPSGDIVPAQRSFSIAESELTLFANVDDRIFGSLTFALSPDNTVEVEEAWGLFTAVPDGFAPKFGRFLSGIGYLNEQHQHTWDFYDAPLVYQAFLGGQYRNDGVQLKWVAPTETFVELGGELGSGAAFPGTGRNKNGVGNGTAFVHVGGDIDASNSWRAGLSYLQTTAQDREYTQPDVAGNDAQLAFSGRTQLAIADFVWKWAPHGNARETNLKVQGEYFRRRERGELTYDADGAPGLAQTGAYRANQSGFYVQGVWQFAPQWRIGGRYDWLDPGRVDYGPNEPYLANGSFNPQRTAVMLDWTPSEFSRFRIQYQQARLKPDFTDNELFVQYILTLGAHGAHRF